MFLVWVVGVVFLVSWALTWCVRGAQEAMLARLPVGTEVPREERGVIHVAFALGISECEVRELHRTGQMPPPCTERPLRWERGVIDPWIEECLLRSLLERSGPGARMMEHLESLGQGEDLLAMLGMGLPAGEALLRPPVVVLPIEETDEAVLGELARRPAVPYDLEFLERVLGAAERLLGEKDEGNKKKEVFSSWNVDHLGTLGVPREGDTRMAGPVLPSGDSGDFPWDNWTQRTTPFLWNLADIAHRLALPVKDVESMHACGLLPPPVWPDPPLWHGQVIDPWMRDVPADVGRVSQVFLADQQGIPVLEIEDTLVGFGLVGLGGLARRTGYDLTTLRQWYREGCPVPLPHPDMSATNLDTGIEEPYWFLDGHIRKWLERMNTKKPAPDRGKVGKERENAPCHRKGSVMGKIYDRLRRDFDATLTAMSTEASLKDLAEDFPRVMSLAVRLDTPIEKIVPFADKLALAGMWSGLEVDRETLESPRAAGVFARGLQAIAFRVEGRIEESVGGFAVAQVLSDVLPATAIDFLRLHRALSERRSSSHAIGKLALREVAKDEEGAYAAQARYWLADTEMLAGRFREGLTAIEAIDEPMLEVDRFRSVGLHHEQNGNFAAATTAYEDSLRAARALSFGKEAEAMAYHARLACLHSPNGQELAEQAIAANQRVKNKIEEQRARVALAMAMAGREPDDRVETAIRRAEELAIRSGNRTGELHAVFAQAFHAAVTNNTQRLITVIDRLDTLSQAACAYGFWTDIARAWTGEDTADARQALTRWQWLNDSDETMQRWREVVTARQGTT